jgi:hypothetical protein
MCSKIDVTGNLKIFRKIFGTKQASLDAKNFAKEQ